VERRLKQPFRYLYFYFHSSLIFCLKGIGEEFDKKRLLRAFKKKFACNGTVVDHKEYGEVIQLQGDQRTNVSQFLTETGICPTEQLKVHGF